MELKDIILEYKKRYNYSNSELAQIFKVTPMTIRRWLSGQVKTIQDETAMNMSYILGYDVQSLLNGHLVDLKKPILGMVKAGYDMFLDQDYLGDEIVSSKEYEEGDFFLRVKGDSMINSGIIDGGLVYVKATPLIASGDIGVIVIDNEVTIKTYQKTKEGIALIASNPDYPTRYYSHQEIYEHSIKIIGKVLFAKNIF